MFYPESLDVQKPLNLVHLRSFLAVVDSGSFIEAARRLALAQSTVSQHIQRLEDCIGAPLIVRGRQGCRPTPQARRFMPHARSLLRMQDRAVQAIDDCRPRLGACSNIGIYLLPVICVASP
jgi:DNA-binding transcriptional LysR family regulator